VCATRLACLGQRRLPAVHAESGSNERADLKRQRGNRKTASRRDHHQQALTLLLCNVCAARQGQGKADLRPASIRQPFPTRQSPSDPTLHAAQHSTRAQQFTVPTCAWMQDRRDRAAWYSLQPAPTLGIVLIVPSPLSKYIDIGVIQERNWDWNWDRQASWHWLQWLACAAEALKTASSIAGNQNSCINSSIRESLDAASCLDPGPPKLNFLITSH
jgi:hypothetical protein